MIYSSLRHSKEKKKKPTKTRKDEGMQLQQNAVLNKNVKIVTSLGK